MSGRLVAKYPPPDSPPAMVSPLCTCPRIANGAPLVPQSERPTLPGCDTGRSSMPAVASFGAGELPPGGECRRLDRRAPQVAPGMRPGSVWCATPNGKQISTRRRDVRFFPTCQSRRSCCGRLTQREDGCSDGSVAVRLRGYQGRRRQVRIP